MTERRSGVIHYGNNKIKKMLKNMESILAAVSFAEEGETATAQSLLKEERRVLLALKEGRIDARTLKYALNTAKRIGAHLDILYVAGDGGRSAAMRTVFSASSNPN